MPASIKSAIGQIPVCLVLCLVAVNTSQAEDPAPATLQASNYNYEDLSTRVAAGQATLAEVRQSLTDRDTGRLTNTVHALYSMRWHRGVNHILRDMWELNTDNFPELSWELIREPPVRIAVASTISRIQVTDISVYLDYIRSYENHEHEFIRAQVVIGLGLNGNNDDVPYIKAMADGDNHYITQSAITALALMNSNPARDALEDLWFKHKGTPRQDLIGEVLRQAYNRVPMEKAKD